MVNRANAIQRLFCAVILCAVPHAHGSTVVPMNLATASEYAGQVLAGTVISLRSYWTGTPPEIETEIILNDVTFFKGEPVSASTTASLTLPGGMVDGFQMRIAGAPELRIGQRWFLFLLSEYRTFPIVGIWEGAFRLQTGLDGVERIYLASGKPVERIDDGGFVRAAGGTTHRGSNCAGSECVGLPTADPGAVESDAMSLGDFLEALRPILRESKVHRGAGPQRVSVTLTPVPLLSADDLPGSHSQEDKARRHEPSPQRVPHP